MTEASTTRFGSAIWLPCPPPIHHVLYLDFRATTDISPHWRREALLSYQCTTCSQLTPVLNSQGMSRGMRRAREVYLLRNTLTGIALLSFITGVYVYAISSVKQESFDDVDEMALVASMNASKSAPATAPTSTTPAAAASLAAIESRPASTSTSVSPLPLRQGAPRGLLPRLLGSRFPSLLDPQSKTLVFGAPPLDRPSRWGESRQ